MPGSREGRTSSRAGQFHSLVNGGRQSRRVSTLDGVDDGAGAQDDEGGHGADAVLRGNLALAVDVDLAEGDLARLGVLGGQRLEGGRDHFAGTAPVGVDWVSVSSPAHQG